MKLYNSLSRTKEEFVPLASGRVGMYVCGPTVYDEPHIGHARSAYIFDVIRRYLAYRGFTVTFVRNVTDVDDKIIDKARTVAGATGDLHAATRDVATKYLTAYHEALAALGIQPPTHEPKATAYIPKMIAFIELLIRHNAAYVADGDVYFDITRAAAYGKLSNQNIAHMEAGSRVTAGEKKRTALDFALWKKAKEGEPSWQSPWGAGRPGWHIECSAMSSDILGDTFDIHCGGIDLIFPHHENEIAQSEGAGKQFARYWLHNGLLTINSEKMAKSLGNFITISDFLARYHDPDYLKLFFLSGHYRSPIDYTDEKIAEAKKEKERFTILMGAIDRRLAAHPHAAPAALPAELRRAQEAFIAAMDDDFNMPQALAVLFEVVTVTNKHIDDDAFIASAKKMLSDLAGIFALTLGGAVEDLDQTVKALIAERTAARKAGDFARADEVRSELVRRGIILEDTKDGTVWRKKI